MTHSSRCFFTMIFLSSLSTYPLSPTVRFRSVYLELSQYLDYLSVTLQQSKPAANKDSTKLRFGWILSSFSFVRFRPYLNTKGMRKISTHTTLQTDMFSGTLRQRFINPLVAHGNLRASIAIPWRSTHRRNWSTPDSRCL